MKMIVGLGNPGKQYEKTRHNLGFLCIDEIAGYHKIDINKKKYNGYFGEGIINNEQTILLKPAQYINLSGEVIKKFVNYYKIELKDILIIVDDMDLKIGSYKLKAKGTSAGHNGLKSIEQALQTNEYQRMKIGISHNELIDSKSHVLGKLTKEELKIIEEIVVKTPFIINDFVTISFENLMNKYN